MFSSQLSTHTQLMQSTGKQVRYSFPSLLWCKPWVITLAICCVVVMYWELIVPQVRDINTLLHLVWHILSFLLTSTSLLLPPNPHPTLLWQNWEMAHLLMLPRVHYCWYNSLCYTNVIWRKCLKGLPSDKCWHKHFSTSILLWAHFVGSVCS